jgi:glyoxylase-like metal-dependent hydrolase (beta-lactamase superfamily II)
LGKLLANLRAAGYTPEQVDDIWLTHMHADHAGGLVSGDTRAFPNAVVHVNRNDTAYWLSETKMNAARVEAQRFFKAAMASVAPYVRAGALKTFDGSAEPAPGVRAVPAYGHTPGHTIYMVESKGEKLLLAGDLVHVAAVQFEDPAVTIAFDTDDAPASAERRKIVAEAAKNGWLLGGAHLSFPGLGHVLDTGGNGGKGYVFEPLNYSALR